MSSLDNRESNIVRTILARRESRSIKTSLFLIYVPWKSAYCILPHDQGQCLNGIEHHVFWLSRMSLQQFSYHWVYCAIIIWLSALYEKGPKNLESQLWTSVLFLVAQCLQHLSCSFYPSDLCTVYCRLISLLRAGASFSLPIARIDLSSRMLSNLDVFDDFSKPWTKSLA